MFVGLLRAKMDWFLLLGAARVAVLITIGWQVTVRATADSDTQNVLGQVFQPELLNHTVPKFDSRAYKVIVTRNIGTTRQHPERALTSPERRWCFLGLGLCPAPNDPRSLRRSTEARLISCLAVCAAWPSCQVVSWSQQRRECIQATAICDPAKLHWYTSYATFVRPDFLDDSPPLTRYVVGNSGNDLVHVYAFSSPMFAPLVNAFVTSMRLAADDAVLLLHHLRDDYMETSCGKELCRPWGTADDMRERDYQKNNLLARAVWESIRIGARHSAFSDLDVQLLPGWSQLVRGCTTAVPLCLSQQPGLFPERSSPFNSGFLAFRGDMASMELLLDLSAQFEPQFMPERYRADSKAAAGRNIIYHLEQDVMSQYLIERGGGMWGVFNPQLVRASAGFETPQVLKLKVYHACSSSITWENKLTWMHKVRRAYYSVYPLCLSANQSGPQHPCCLLYGYQRTVFSPELPDLPPYLAGSIYGYSKVNQTWPWERRFWTRWMGAGQYSKWFSQCECLHKELMHTWNEDPSNAIEMFTHVPV